MYIVLNDARTRVWYYNRQSLKNEKAISARKPFIKSLDKNAEKKLFTF